MKWRGKVDSENTWITTIDFQKLNPDFYELDQASNSLELSSFKLGGENLLKYIQERKGKT